MAHGLSDLGIGGGTSVNGTSYVFDDLTNAISTIDLSTGVTSPAGSFDSSAGVIQGAAPDFQFPVLTSGNQCNGTYTGPFNGNLTVTNGQTCVLVGGEYAGNVSLNGGKLSISNAVIDGNVQVQGGGTFTIGPDAAIDGNLEVQNLGFGVTPSQVCGTFVAGNLEFQNIGAPVQIGSASLWCAGNVIGGNLEAQVSTGVGSIAIVNNIVGGNLLDLNNAAPTQVVDNQVTQDLQCQNNVSITGSGNSAGQKKGQCKAL